MKPHHRGAFTELGGAVTLDLEQVTDRRAPKKMGSSAMNTRLPYASAVPSGVATNLAVTLSTSVPLESVAFRASRIAAAAASGAESGTGSASDMVLQTRAFRGPRAVLVLWYRLVDRIEVEAEAVAHSSTTVQPETR